MAPQKQIKPGSSYFTGRLVLAIISTALEEIAIVLVWRWVLPYFGISIPVPWLVVIMAGWAAISVALFVFVTRMQKKQPMVGMPIMVGSKGRVVSPLVPEGLVKIKSELWSAVAAEGNLVIGEEVEVTEQNGLKLVVRKIGSEKFTR
jgi:membrane-bound ClpP family serine protease